MTKRLITLISLQGKTAEEAYRGLKRNLDKYDQVKAQVESQQKPKRSLSTYLIGAGVILVPCLGAFLFIQAVGLDGTAILVVGIVGFIGLVLFLSKFSEMLGYYVCILALVLIVFYAFNLWWVLAIPIVVAAYLAVYIVGEHFGWLKQSDPYR